MIIHLPMQEAQKTQVGSRERQSWSREWQSTPVFLPRKSHGQEEPGGLQSMGSQRVTHDCTHTHTKTRLNTHTHTLEQDFA